MSKKELQLRMSPGDIAVALKVFSRLAEQKQPLDAATAPTLLSAAAEMIARQQKDIDDLKRNSLSEDDVAKIAANVLNTRLGKTDSLRELLDALNFGDTNDKIFSRLAKFLADMATRLPDLPAGSSESVP